MNCCEDAATIRQRESLAARSRQHDRPLQDSMRGNGAERDNKPWPDQREFPIEPPAAGLHLAAVWMFVEPALAALLVFEVLHRIGHISRAAVKSHLRERLIENASGGSDKGPANAVFLIARLLADQHDQRPDRAFAKYGLRRVPVKRTALAMRGFTGDLPQLGGRFTRNRRACRFVR